MTGPAFAGNRHREWKSYEKEAVCLELRRIVQQPKLKGTVQAAMILAFVGAVEQNIIGLPGNFTERFKEQQVVSVSIRQRIENYLRKVRP